VKNPEFISASVARRDFFGGIAPNTEWRWAKTLEEFPQVVRIGPRRFYRRADVIAFMETRMQSF
jgi:predicted DNA-binding transcriptional regulator AlpA